MTTSTPPEPNENDDQEHGDVVAKYETVRVRDRLVQRTCGWCAVVLRYGGVGRPPKFCCDDHRKRWHERENAKKALGLDTAAPEPVREVIERTETRVRTVVRKGPTVLQPVPARPDPSQADLRFPTSFDDWRTMLAYLRADAPELREHPRAAELRMQLRRLATEDFPGAFESSPPRTVDAWYSHLRVLLDEVRAGAHSAGDRRALASVFTTVAEQLRDGQAAPAPVPAQPTGISRAERRRRERDARKGRG
ncbi:hypothetical protein ABT237_34980 [Streptomyces sp. NPDC001581]|uniref:hypothetical protein n=1 Tax=Streptomyces sp. NPDC001581 TaxID=3154386 RepID=UPI0033324DA0